MHLFDIIAPDGTGYRESNTYGAGDEVVTYEADGIKVGCAICYDIRFPDLFWKLREQGADVIFLPSAFTLATGKDHWEVLIRGRAIETQCWFAAPATWGKHLEGKGEPRFTYGHSLICDPVGPRGDARCRTAPAGPPRASTRRSPRGCAATCRCWNTGNAFERPAADRRPAGHLRPGADRVSLCLHRRWRPTRCNRLMAPLRRLPAGARQRGGDAGRRRFDAGDDPPRAGPTHPGLRHELRLGRLPDEHVQRGRPAGAAGPRAGGGTASAAHARGDRAPARRCEALAFNEVSLLRQLRQSAKIRITVDGTGAAGGIVLRRRADLHAGGVDRVQPVGARSDRAAVGEPAAADADLRVPPPALARRAAAQHGARCCSRCWRPTSARPPRSPTSPRCAMSRRWRCSEDRSSHGDGAVRSGPRPVGTHHRRAIHRLTTQGRFGTARPIT